MTGIKFDDGKVRPSLVFDDMKNALNEVIKVAEFGARKYAAGNWLKVEDGKQRYKEAKYRHAMANLGSRDDESQLLHLAHEAWNVLALLELQLREEYGLAESSKFQRDLFIPEQAAFKHGFGFDETTGDELPEFVTETTENVAIPDWATRLFLSPNGEVFADCKDKTEKIYTRPPLAFGVRYLPECWEIKQ